MLLYQRVPSRGTFNLKPGISDGNLETQAQPIRLAESFSEFASNKYLN